MSMVSNTEGVASSFASLQPSPNQAEHWFAREPPVPFDTAAQYILDAHRDDGSRGEIVVHQLRTWAFCSSDGRTMEVAALPFDGRETSDPLALRQVAFNQLCSRIGVPAQYIRSLPLPLQLACMNWGLVRHEEPALLRTAGKEVRAILSNKYAAADDQLVLAMVGEALDRCGYRGDARVRAVATGPHTVLRITLPSEAMAVKTGDVIEHGIDVANSELGLRSIQVTPVTYRLVCTNGLRAWRSSAAVRLRHSGDPHRLRDELRDAIPTAFAEARGDIDRWKRAVNRLVESAADEIAALSSYGLSNSDIDAIGQTFAQEEMQLPSAESSAGSIGRLKQTRTTAFAITNAMTATARNRQNVAARLNLEETAHRYLSAVTQR